jgi:hypothetical protein
MRFILYPPSEKTFLSPERPLFYFFSCRAGQKTNRARYTLEYKQEAVRLVKAGQSMAAVAATLGALELPKTSFGSAFH